MEAFHNDFHHDSTSERAHRLRRIQHNAVEILALLSPTADIAAWIAVCYDEYDVSRVTKGVKMGFASSQRILTTGKIKELAVIYQRFKRFAASHFADRPAIVEEFGFTRRASRSQDGIMKQAALALATYARLIAAAEPDMLPAAVVEPLQTAYNEAADESTKLTPKRSEKVQTSGEYKRIWKRDTHYLGRLLALWYAMQGTEKSSISYVIGCYNPRPRRSGMPPPPENLRRDGQNVLWDAAERATTYQAQFRPAPPPETEQPAGKKKKSRQRTRINWQRLYQGEETQCPLPAKPSATGYEIRVRARNANGFGKWSAEYRTA